MHDQHARLVRLQRFHDFLELEIAASFVGPKVRRDGAVGAEDDDQSLAWPNRAAVTHPRLGKPTRKGRAEAEMPNCLRNWRRRIIFIAALNHNLKRGWFGNGRKARQLQIPLGDSFLPGQIIL